jgi:hypothetical protein
MAIVVKDRVKVSSTIIGTGTATLGAAATGYQSFSAIGTGNTTYYTIAAQSGADWEVGIGTVTDTGGGVYTLSRDTVLESSSGGTLVSFTTGTKDVFVTYPAERSVYLDSAGSYPVQSTFNAITANSIALTAGTVSTTPGAGTDIANKTYVDTVAAQGITYHSPVYVESPDTAGSLNALYNQPGGAGVGVGATLTNNGTKAALTIDGVLMTTTKRVLIYNQTSAFQNGVYTVTTVGTPDPGGTNWVLTRATDADTYAVNSPTALGQGDAFFVTAGNTGAGELYVMNHIGTITFGTTDITFAQISAAIPYIAGTGLNLNPSTTFNISNTGVTAASYGIAAQVPTLAINAQGQITSAVNTPIAIAVAAVSGLAASATTDTTNASNITSGALGTARLSGSYTGITGVGALAAGSLAAGFTAVSAPLGGTGQTSYAVGDLLYASTTTALSKLADVAVGNALISGGVSTAPSWGKVGLATHVSGTLPVANGGTGATTLTGYVYGTGTGAMTASTSIPNAATTATSANTASAIVARDISGNFTAGTITAALSGNATTATSANFATSAGSVTNAATFNNGGGGAVSGSTFNGAGALTVSYNTVGASPLAGSASLTTTGAVTSGTWSGSFGAVSGANLTSLTALNLTGTIPSAVLGNSTAYVGTTAVPLNRASANQAMTGILSVTMPGSTSGSTVLQPSAAAGTTTITMPATTGTMALTSDIPSVGNGTLTLATSGTGLSGSASFTANQAGATTFTVTSNATSANTASTIVARDGSGNFSAGTITAALSGNATSATNATNAANLSTGTSIKRTVAGAGYLDGMYSGVESTGTSGAIYSIGGTYVPGTTTLGNMYGIGYGYSGNAGITATSAPASLWGMYVASAGVSRIFFDSDNGRGFFNGAVYSAGTVLTGNTGTVTSVGGTAPVVSSGGTAPVISMAAASSGVNGYMTGTYATKLDGIAAGATNVTNTNQLTNGAGYITSSGSISGNAATATNLSTGRTNWVTNGTLSAVVGQLGWKNFGNNHTIFDASASTAPDGSAVNNTNSQSGWAGTYPTLMGWNGTNTYGVRVDSARVSDSTSGNAATAGGFTPSQTNGTANRIVVADASGYINNNYFNSTDNSTASGVSAVMVKAGDNYLRSGTAAAVATFISGQSMNIAGSSTSCSGNAATASATLMSSGRTDAAAYPVVWATTGANSQMYSCTAVNIQSSTGTLNASNITLPSAAPVITLAPSGYVNQYQTTLGTRAGAEAFLIFGNNGPNEIRAGRTAVGGILDFFTNNTVGQASASDGVRAMRMDTSGNVMVGTTNTSPISGRVNGSIFYANGGNQSRTTNSNRDWGIAVTSGSIINFYSDNGSAAVYAGSINVNGNTTSYTSVSDYRLKENVQPMTGALAKVQALNPVTYTFKDGGQVSQGFIAHELQAIIPDAVTGEKDAVKEDGSPAYQGIDTSFLVATLTAAIQEQQALITALTARIAALEPTPFASYEQVGIPQP